jgi:MYXO-CTERM domain-containing protein
MSIRTTAFLVIAVSVAIVAVSAKRVRADVPPPDLCTSPGQPCQNAGAQFNQAGTCMATTCTKTVPNGDGGTTTMTYDCNLCRMVDGGTNGGGTSSGCAIAARSSGTAHGSAVALVLLGIALARRRRTRR